MGFNETKKLEDRFVMHTFGRKPVMFVEGNGMELKDDSGNTYLDFIAGIGADSLGHCHPAVVNAIKTQAEKLIHVSNYYYIEHRAEVAQIISDMLNECVPNFFRAPWPVFFANSGAEANECAIKLARLYQKKVNENMGADIIVTFDGSFHGRTLATLAATAQPAKQEAFQPLPEGFTSVPINDLKAMQELLYSNMGRIAAIMVEPIQGESGVHPCDGDYLFEVCKLARQHGVLIIADEVQTGFYRCGEHPFMCQNLGVTPDIVTMAKGIASGFPMGACAARVEVAEAFEPGDHGSTFGGSNLAMAAAHATLTTLQSGAFADRVTQVGDYFAEKLSTLEDVKEVRGSGLMVAVELADDLDAHKVVLEGLGEGFVLNATGPHTLRFLPPLVCETYHIDQLIAAFPTIFAEARED